MPDDFSKMLAEFYIGFVNSLADSVEKLAEIQKNFSDKYKTIVGLEEDPGAIEELAKNLSSEEKELLLITLVKASTLARRANKVFDLTVDEKKTLAEDLRKFGVDLKARKDALR